MADRPLITGSFSDPDAADRAYSSFRERGYTDDDLHVMMSEDTKEAYHSRPDAAIDEGSKALEGAGTGAAIGGSLGGILGAIAAVGTAVALPGVGLIAGPLVGAGIPEEHAKTYESDLKNGRIVVGAHPRDEDRDLFRDTYSQNNASNVYSSY